MVPVIRSDLLEAPPGLTSHPSEQLEFPPGELAYVSLGSVENMDILPGGHQLNSWDHAWEGIWTITSTIDEWIWAFIYAHIRGLCSWTLTQVNGCW